MALVDKVVEVHHGLDAAGVDHAFGGAIALGYHARPRGTVEIDLNVFLPQTEAGLVISTLKKLGVRPPHADVGRLLPTAGVMCPWEETHLDIFFSYDAEFFGSVARRVEDHLFIDSSDGEHVLPFLSAEDLVIFKILLDRPEDWVDIRHILEERPLDADYVEGWLLHLRGESEWPTIRRFLSLQREVRS